MKKWIIILFILGSLPAFAATITITNVNEKLSVNKDGNHELNLSQILNNTAEIAEVKIRAKSDFGGSQVYLEINGVLSNGGVIDTDPALYDAQAGYAELLLQNYERSNRQIAKLIFTPAHNAKIQSVEVTLGEAENLIALKDYKNPLVIANETGPQPRPLPLPPELRPVVVAPSPQPVSTNCVPQRSGKLICLRDRVRNRLGEFGVITRVHHTTPSQVTVVFEGRPSMTRDADYVLFIARP